MSADPEKDHGPLVTWAHWIRAGVFRSLSPCARDIGAVLATFASKEGLAFPSAQTLATITGHTRTTVFKGLRELQEHKVIARQGHVRRKHRNAAGPVMYRFLPSPPPMCLSGRDVSVTETHSLAERFKRPVTGNAPVRENALRCLSERDGGSPARETGVVLSERHLLCVSATETQKGLNGPSEGVNVNTREGGVQRGEPDASARFASPSETASLASAVTDAWERKGTGNGKPDEATRRLASLRELFDGLSANPAEAAALARKCGYTEAEILAVSPDAGNGHCRGVNSRGLECVSRAVPGTGFCWRHQGQGRA